MPEPQPGEMTLTINMEDTEDPTIYPAWLQSNGKKDNQPRKRGKQIYRTGKQSSLAESCVYCIALRIPCIRSQGSKYGKCCSCTVRDLHPKGVCRLVGEPFPEGELSETAKSKTRQVESDIAKVQRQGDTMSENGFGHFQASLSIPTTSAPSTSLCVPRSAAPSASASIPRSMPSRGARSFAPSPEPAAMQIDAPNGSNATLERVTVLESQVARLEANFLMLRVKLQEIESSVGPTPAPRSPVADSASTANNNTIRRPSTMMIHRIINQPSPIELPAGPALTDVDEGWDGEVTPKHTVAHTEGFRPDNCICAHSDQPDDADSDMADAN